MASEDTLGSVTLPSVDIGRRSLWNRWACPAAGKTLVEQRRRRCAGREGEGGEVDGKSECIR